MTTSTIGYDNLYYCAASTKVCVEDLIAPRSPHYYDRGNTLCGAVISSSATCASRRADCPGCLAAIEEAHAEAIHENTLRAGGAVVATAQVNGAIRVITLTVEQNDLGAHVVTLRAYDSNHPGAQLTILVAGDPDRDTVIAQGRAFAAAALRPSAPFEPCNCWAEWGPYCGAPGCWGDHRHPLATLAASNS